MDLYKKSVRRKVFMKKTKKGLLIWFAAVLLATMFVPVSVKAASKKNVKFAFFETSSLDNLF